ncbi:MAG: iron-containing alcohol dehydrogenase family protein [Deltaproteobacteria bacterium]|nr:iron-containing alcohol dehydrogenase family protein [Deltaproteobacteria bacterium]NCP02943.1 iron-containing alcohol dehydrogenase family protein [Deltaproteobacteria bacterium]NCP78185.1 iron-containing alcohol dehydrogenase family protein [Desulfuromonadales bacterium]
MKLLNKLIDQCVNRASGAYKGYLSPKIPKQFTIPLIEEVGHGIDSIPALLHKRLHRDMPRLRFNTPLVICDAITREIAGKKLLKQLEQSGARPRAHIIASNSYAEVEQIFELALKRLAQLESPCAISSTPFDQKYGAIKCGEKRFDIVYGVGGGSVIDVAKYTAYKLNLPFVSVPTSLANDGFASPFAVLNLGSDGTMTLSANTPLAVIVDIELIKSDDSGYQRRIRSGVGDLLSNLTAVLDWKLADLRGKERFESYSAYLATCGARLVIKELLAPREDLFYSAQFLEILACSLMASAEAMSRYGSSRPASGFEHKLYHAYNELTGFKLRATHGELVAVGSLFSCRAHGQNLDDLTKAFRTIGLPIDEAGLQECGIEREILIAAVAAAREVKPGRYTILEEGGVEKLLTALSEIYPAKPG